MKKSKKKESNAAQDEYVKRVFAEYQTLHSKKLVRGELLVKLAVARIEIAAAKKAFDSAYALLPAYAELKTQYKILESRAQQMAVIGVGELLRLVVKQRAQRAAIARHNKPGGARDKQKKILEAWGTGEYRSHSHCAFSNFKKVGFPSKEAAERALVGAPKQTKKIMSSA